MIKILLVDDEVAICSGMKRLILKADPDSFEVAEAYDGVEALDLIDSFQPDVLLTDMRMPRLDGLGLLREAKIKRPDLLTAVISAYSDYEYIREAMLLHASDYLLKPATLKHVQELLGKLKSKVNQLTMKKEQAAFGALIQDSVPSGSSLSSLSGYTHFSLLLVCAGPYINSVMDGCPGDVLWESPLFAEYANRCEEQGIRRWVVPGERPNERFVLLGTCREDAETCIRVNLESFLQSLTSQQLPVSMLAAAGISLDQLFAVSKRMRRELLRCLVFAKSGLVYLNEPSGGTSAEAEPDEEAGTAKLLSAVEQGNPERLREELHALMESWERTGATQYRIQQSLFRVLTSLGESSLKSQIDLELAVNHSLSYDELRESVSAFFENLFHTPNMAAKSARSGTTVGQVEQYLKMNYRESITLQSLSQEFGLVPNYLSVLFKKEIGVTPLEYLVEYRIKEAKRMLDKQPQMLLKQVAGEVGYSDQLYFSRVFKKLTGQSPSEYVQSRHR